MSDTIRKLGLDKPGTYEIKVPGRLDEGWSERTRKEFSNGTEINYIRNGLDLRLSIRKSSPVWTVRVEADPGAGRRGMLIGALVGVVVAGGVLVAASRSQRGSEPQEPSVRSRA